MTKSIEEQAEKFSNEYAVKNYKGYEYYVEDFKNGFLAGAKAREEQLMGVVNELREALKFTIEESGTSTNYNLKCRNSITKADQMLKEMEISL